ncbi:TolC family protein [Hyalangium versicolor]|uniref:TolC family protein n=1 Tax=Hyalangium versicolor TaxID=2861190 RepID=UPI001CCC3C62|nr:TolC family protein [Hyalangium versicolor]
MKTSVIDSRGAHVATHTRRVSLLVATVMLAPLSASAQAPAAAAPSQAPESAVPPVAVVEASARGRQVALKEALALSAKQSPDIAAARAQAELARASVGRAWAAWKPDITATGQIVHTSAPSSLDLGQFVGLVGQVYQIPPQNLGALPPPVPIVGVNSRYATLQISQPLFTPQGAFLIGPAQAGSEAAALGAQEAREQVLLNVARTYLGLQGVEQLIEAAREAEAVALKREKDARAQLEVGMAVEVSLLRAQTETAQARAQLAQLAGQRAQLLAMLEALVGEPVTPLPAGASGVEWGGVKDEQAQPWEQTYSVRSATKAFEAAEGVLRYDRFAWLPSVAAVGKGNYNSNTGFSGQTTSYDLILAVTVPLYDRGLRYAAKREDEAKLAQAKAQLDGSRAKARATWVAARANLEAAQAALTQAEAQAQLAARAQKQVEASARAGVVTNLELSDADSRRFLAASAAAQSRAAVDIRRAELAAAEGQLAALVQAE